MGCLWRVIEAQSWRCMADNICLSVRRAGGLERWGNTGRGRRGGEMERTHSVDQQTKRPCLQRMLVTPKTQRHPLHPHRTSPVKCQFTCRIFPSGPRQQRAESKQYTSCQRCCGRLAACGELTSNSGDMLSEVTGVFGGVHVKRHDGHV